MRIAHPKGVWPVPVNRGTVPRFLKDPVTTHTGGGLSFVEKRAEGIAGTLRRGGEA